MGLMLFMFLLSIGAEIEQSWPNATNGFWNIVGFLFALVLLFGCIDKGIVAFNSYVDRRITKEVNKCKKLGGKKNG